ncbi:hypothetical protein N9386_01935 [Gammaproteobacteria bacterium]|nr:hypothetical protein [Gammaproteobacteria bacterium]
MNTCFAICITLLIYQNTQLKDEIETVKGFSQLDVDKSWDRMDELESRIDFHQDTLVSQKQNMVEIRDLLREVSDSRYESDVILQKRVDKISDWITDNQDYLFNK